jgi:hypothetical protein
MNPSHYLPLSVSQRQYFSVVDGVPVSYSGCRGFRSQSGISGIKTDVLRYFPKHVEANVRIVNLKLFGIKMRGRVPL